MASKKKCQQIHASRRAAERLGERISRDSTAKIVKDIQLGKAKFIRRQSLRVALFLVSFKGKDVVAVYDKKRHSIATFLTLEMAGISPQIEVLPKLETKQNSLQMKREIPELTETQKAIRNLSRGNYAALYIGKKCGCYYCCRIYEPHLVKSWCDKAGDTAICPFCGVDSVIPDTPEVPLTEKLLKDQNAFWFNSRGSQCLDSEQSGSIG